NLCKVLVAAGCGMDVTSGGELFRALKAGCDPKKIIYAGVGKTDDEIRMAIDAGIAAFNIESEAEIENIDRVAGELGKAQICALAKKGHKIEWRDMGGGFAVNYKNPEQALPVTEHAKALVPLLKGKPYKLAIEPGRYISGNAGIVLTRVLYRKQGGEK